MLYAPRIYLLESLSKTFYVAQCSLYKYPKLSSPMCVSSIGGRRRKRKKKKKEMKNKGCSRVCLQTIAPERERERVFYFLTPRVNSYFLGRREGINFTILLRNLLCYISINDKFSTTIVNYRLFVHSSRSKEYIIDIKYRINAGRGRRRGKGRTSRGFLHCP